MNATINAIIAMAITNIISGIFIGLGIAMGVYHALKSRMPIWIKEITDQLRKNHAIEQALDARRHY